MVITKLSNGINVVYEKIDTVRSVTLGIWIKNGSAHEPEKLNGISHFIEHMLFKGTKNRTATQIANEMDAIAAQMNAFTTKEATCYHFRVLDTHFEKALDVLSDMFLNSLYDEKEILKERSVILEEISMYEDDPEDVSFECLANNVYKGNSYGRPILGTKETLNAFTHQTFADYIKEVYCVENIYISVSGHFEEEQLKNDLEKYFGDYKNSNKAHTVLEPPTSKLERIKLVKEIEQVHLNLQFDSIGYLSDKAYALNVFNTHFGGSMSSILFQKIREQHGYAYSVFSQPITYANFGSFNIYAGLNKEYVNHVVEIVNEEIKNFRRDKIDKDKLSVLKEQFKSSYIMAQENTNSRMLSNGRSLVLRGRIITPDEVVEKIDKVSMDDIVEVCEEVFKNPPSVSLVGNVGDIDINKIF